MKFTHNPVYCLVLPVLGPWAVYGKIPYLIQVPSRGKGDCCRRSLSARTKQMITYIKSIPISYIGHFKDQGTRINY
jgi:hypothetical protein